LALNENYLLLMTACRFIGDRIAFKGGDAKPFAARMPSVFFNGYIFLMKGFKG